MNKWLDSYSRFYEQIERTLESHRQLYERMERWMQPHLELQQQIDRLLEPQRRLYDLAEKWLEPQRRLQEQIEKLVHPQLEWRSQIEEWLEPHRRMEEQLASALNANRQWEELIRPAWSIGQELEKIFTPQIEISRLFESVLGGLTADDVVIDASGEISVSGDSVGISELTEVLQQVSSAISRIPSPAEFLRFVLQILSRAKRPIASIILILVLPFLLNVAANLSTSYFQGLLSEHSHKPRRERIKLFQNEASNNFDLSLLSSYRFTTADVLNVRGHESTKSRIIGRLYFGQVVRLVTKGRKWSYVEYINEDTGSEVRGWVFSRYLRKFKY